jgi:hypothetical protein
MINLNYKDVIEFLSFLRVRVDSGPGDFQLLGLQGCIPSKINQIVPAQNAPNVYNDSIIYVGKNPDNSHFVEAYLGTVDPGNAYLNQPGGQAHLTFGQHFYVRGPHMGYPALRGLNGRNRIWRDLDSNHVISPGDYVSEGQFGVNIHAGGDGPLVNNWSAGCVNICGGWVSPQYLRLISLADQHLVNKPDLGLTVWSYSDFSAFILKPWGTKPTLRFGVRNPWVGELQSLLTAKGYFSGTIDSDFQGKTDAAVRAFQLAKGLKVDAVVGQQTWAELINYYHYIQSMLTVNTQESLLAARMAFDQVQSLRCNTKSLTPSEIILLQVWESAYKPVFYPK